MHATLTGQQATVFISSIQVIFYMGCMFVSLYSY